MLLSVGSSTPLVIAPSPRNMLAHRRIRLPRCRPSCSCESLVLDRVIANQDVRQRGSAAGGQ
jgi:hypothetical protein